MGHGIFATQDIKEFIFIPILGPRASEKSESHLWVYTTDELQHLAAVDGRPRTPGTAAGHGLAVAMMVNQASEGEQINCILWCDGILTLRSLKAGEELLTDYGPDHATNKLGGPIAGRLDGTDPPGMKQRPTIAAATSFVNHYATNTIGHWSDPRAGKRSPNIEATYAYTPYDGPGQGKTAFSNAPKRGKCRGPTHRCMGKHCNDPTTWTNCKGCKRKLCSARAGDKNPENCEACRSIAQHTPYQNSKQNTETPGEPGEESSTDTDSASESDNSEESEESEEENKGAPAKRQRRK